MSPLEKKSLRWRIEFWGKGSIFGRGTLFRDRFRHILWPTCLLNISGSQLLAKLRFDLFLGATSAPSLFSHPVQLSLFLALFKILLYRLEFLGHAHWFSALFLDFIQTVLWSILNDLLICPGSKKYKLKRIFWLTHILIRRTETRIVDLI